MHIGLVADVEEDRVVRGLEHAVETDCEFDHAEVGLQVTTCAGDRGDQVVPDLLRQDLALGVVEFTQL